MVAAAGPELLFIDAVRSCWLCTDENAKTKKTRAMANSGFILSYLLVDECMSIELLDK